MLIFSAFKHNIIITCLWCSYSGSCLALSDNLFLRLTQPILRARSANCDIAYSFCLVSISFVISKWLLSIIHNDQFSFMIRWTWLHIIAVWLVYSFHSYITGCTQINCAHIDAVAVPNGRLDIKSLSPCNTLKQDNDHFKSLKLSIM